MSGLDPAGLDAVYEALAAAIDGAGPRREALLLARLALLLADRVGDAAAVRQAIAEALAGLPEEGADG